MTFEEVDKAIKRGEVVQLREALDGGLNPNLANKFGWTILMAAAMSGNTAVGRLLIARGAYVDSRNKFGDNALSLAIHTGHPSFVKMLLDAGASLDCDPAGNSLDIFLDWVEKYSGNAAQLPHIRKIIDETRKARDRSLSV